MARVVDSDTREPEIETHPIPQKNRTERMGGKEKIAWTEKQQPVYRTEAESIGDGGAQGNYLLPRCVFGFVQFNIEVFT